MEAGLDSDAGLVRRIRQGEEEAFVALYRRLHPPIYRFALRMTGREATAEDVTQEVFLALLDDKFGFVPERGTVSGYLYGVARKLVLRRLERERPELPLEMDEDAGAEPASGQPDALTQLSRNQSIESVRCAVLSLPPRYREVVVLCDLQELDYAAAAAVLDCAVGTVRSRLHRGRAMLVEKLSRSGGRDPEWGGLHPARCSI
jgi:RNA polymerase sigma-70 factor (ECF subfamily)